MRGSRDPQVDARLVQLYVEDAQPEARVQAAFLAKHAGRSLRVAYEDLCAEPAPTAARLCEYLGVTPAPGMTEYGAVAHHEGYGDELSRAHTRPHRESVRRWEGHIDDATQASLARQITAPDLETLGHTELAALASGTTAAA